MIVERQQELLIRIAMQHATDKRPSEVQGLGLSEEARRAIAVAVSARSSRASSFFLDEAIILTHGLGAQRLR